METNCFIKSIDLAQMKTRILDKAKLHLKDINEANLDYFANDVKKIAESIMEKYIFDVYDLYTSGAMAITDINTLAAFTDTGNGFQIKMLQWKRLNNIQISKEKIELPEAPSKPNVTSYHKTTIGVGTIIATGLIIFKHPWIALAIELLTLSTSYVQYKHKTDSERIYKMKLEKYEMEITKLKNSFVNGIISDIEKWLLLGQEKTKEILKSFEVA